MRHVLRWLLMLFALAISQVAIASVMRVVNIPARGNQPNVATPSCKTVSLYTKSAALLISVSKYSGGASGWQPLPSTGKELNAVAEVLANQGFAVTRISDPNREEIIEETQKFLEKYGADEKARLLLLYSGHGYTDSKNQMGYIVPVDAGNPDFNRSRFIAKSISLEHFSNWVRQFNARHFLLMFDSCFSGAIFVTKSNSKELLPRPVDYEGRWRYLVGASEKSARQFISAGGPDEVLPASSVFVDLFIRGIGGQASTVSDGYVTGRELGLYLSQNVSALRAGKQNPISGFPLDLNSSAGDFVFQYRAPDDLQKIDREQSSKAVDSAVELKSMPSAAGPSDPPKDHGVRLHSLRLVLAAVSGKSFSDHADALLAVNPIIPDDLSGEEVALILGDTSFSYRRRSLEILLAKIRHRSVSGKSAAKIIGTEDFSYRSSLIAILEPYIFFRFLNPKWSKFWGRLGLAKDLVPLKSCRG